MRQKGVTLVELIIVIVVTGVVLASLGAILAQGFKSYSAGKNIINTDWQARYVLERLTRELRMINSNADITNPLATSLTIVNSDGDTVQFQLVGTQLLRNGQVLANNIQSLTFSYYAADGSVATLIPNIKYIGIDIQVMQGNVVSYLSTIVYPWNLK